VALRKLKTVHASHGIRKSTKIETEIAKDPLALRSNSAAMAAATKTVPVKTAPVVPMLDGAAVRATTIAIGATPTGVVVPKHDHRGTTWNHAFGVWMRVVAPAAEDAVPAALVPLTALVVAVLEVALWAPVVLAVAVSDLGRVAFEEVEGLAGLQVLSSSGRSAARRRQKSPANCTSLIATWNGSRANWNIFPNDGKVDARMCPPSRRRANVAFELVIRRVNEKPLL
jgi:hypothetical protein